MTKTNPLFSVYGSWGFVGNELCKDDDFKHHEDNPHDFKNKFPSDYPDLVYCISTIHNYNVTDNDPYTDIQTNLTHLMTVLQANKMKYGNDFTITLISTWFVYGKVECPAKEDSVCNPKGFYSITKKTQEDLLISYCETFGIKWKIVRLSNILGVDDKKVSPRRNALQYMVKTLCSGGEINLYDEDCRRDYTHVSDAAEAIKLVAQDGEFGQIYNVGSGQPNSIHRLVGYAHKKSDYIGKINLVTVPEFHKTVQVRDMWLDTTKITELGWKPKMEVETIVEDMCEFFIGEE